MSNMLKCVCQRRKEQITSVSFLVHIMSIFHIRVPNPIKIVYPILLNHTSPFCSVLALALFCYVFQLWKIQQLFFIKLQRFQESKNKSFSNKNSKYVLIQYNNSDAFLNSFQLETTVKCFQRNVHCVNIQLFPILQIYYL